MNIKVTTIVKEGHSPEVNQKLNNRLNVLNRAIHAYEEHDIKASVHVNAIAEEEDFKIMLNIQSENKSFKALLDEKLNELVNKR